MASHCTCPECVLTVLVGTTVQWTETGGHYEVMGTVPDICWPGGGTGPGPVEGLLGFLPGSGDSGSGFSAWGPESLQALGRNASKGSLMTGQPILVP